MTLRRGVSGPLVRANSVGRAGGGVRSAHQHNGRDRAGRGVWRRVPPCVGNPAHRELDDTLPFRRSHLGNSHQECLRGRRHPCQTGADLGDARRTTPRLHGASRAGGSGRSRNRSGTDQSAPGPERHPHGAFDPDRRLRSAHRAGTVRGCAQGRCGSCLGARGVRSASPRLAGCTGGGSTTTKCSNRETPGH